jgi:hypothetical protein
MMLAKQALAQTPEIAIASMEQYVSSNEAFLVLRNQYIRQYELGDPVVGSIDPTLFWLGPPTVVRDEGTTGATGKVIMAVAHVVQFTQNYEDLVDVVGATIPGEWQVNGFAATWNGNGYSYVISDFSDVTQFLFQDALAFQKESTGSWHMPTTMWETSAAGSGGLVGSGFICWQNETDPLVMSMMEKLGVDELEEEDFDNQYEKIWTETHKDKSSTSGQWPAMVIQVATAIATLTLASI